MDNGFVRDIVLLLIFVSLIVMAVLLGKAVDKLERIADVYAPLPVIEEVLPAAD